MGYSRGYGEYPQEVETLRFLTLPTGGVVIQEQLLDGILIGWCDGPLGHFFQQEVNT